MYVCILYIVYLSPIDFCLPLAMAWLKLLYDLMYMIHHEMFRTSSTSRKTPCPLDFEDAQIDSGRQERQLPYEPPEELELRLGALSFDNHRTSLPPLQGRMVIFTSGPQLVIHSAVQEVQL